MDKPKTIQSRHLSNITFIMKRIKLTNLRELSVEEQKQLSGGIGGICDSDCGTCVCTCKCTEYSPSKSTGEDFAATGASSQLARKQQQAMTRKI